MSLLERSLAGALLILVVASLRAVARDRLPKRTFVALWWVAVLRLLAPFALPSRLSVYTLLASLRRIPARVPAGAGTPIRAVPNAALPKAAGTAPQTAAAAPFPVWTALWLAGMVLLALWFAASYILSQRKFRTSLPVKDGCAADWAKAHPRVAVRVSDRISAPLTYGFLRPVILLPKHMDWEDRTALTHILTHEYVHIRHLDGVTKLALAAELCVHWFNPAAWLLYTLANRDIELACDEAVVRLLGRPGAYARTLLRMEETKTGCRPLYSHFSQNAIEERIKAIMKLKKTSALASVCALLLVAGVTTVFATSAQAEPVPQTEPPVPQTESTPLERLESSIVYMDGRLSFTIPEDGTGWSIWIGGRMETDGGGMSVHYLEAESAAGSWEGEKTYRFQVADGPYESLTMFAAVDGEERDIDLTAYLPESGEAAPAETGGQAMIWPTEGTRISSCFGKRTTPGGGSAVTHNGVDIAGAEPGAIRGAAVYAVLDGTVEKADFDAEYGNYVLLDHGGGLETLCSQCESLSVKAGDTVKRGDVIAAVGSTGKATGPFLHFEVRQDGEPQDPLGYFSEDTLDQLGLPWR